MGAIHLTKDDQRVLVDALRDFITNEGENHAACGTDHPNCPIVKDIERAERLARTIQRFHLEDTPT